MPFRTLEERRAYQRNWVRQKRLSIPKPIVTSVGIDKRDRQKDRQTPDVPKAISTTAPILTSSHHYCIRARRTVSGSPFSVPNAEYKERGGGRRVKYAVVSLANCFVEVTRNTVCVVSTRDLVDLDAGRKAALRSALTSVCASRGVRIEDAGLWREGEYSHTVAECEPLNAVLMPLARVEAGDERLRVFSDKSHDGKAELTGSEIERATKNLHYLLLEFPSEFEEYVKANTELQTRMAKALESLAPKPLASGTVGDAPKDIYG